MREKQFRVVVTFRTTTQAMAMESYCAAYGVAGRLIPVPAVIYAECGMCWSAPAEEKTAVREAVRAAGLTDVRMYELLI